MNHAPVKLSATALFLVACAGAAPARSTSADAARGPRSEAPAQATDPLQIEGLLGSLSQAEIHNALAPRMGRFAHCLRGRLEAVPWLSGQLAMRFRVATSGSVRSVWPIASELGDRSTERCLLGVAESTAFPKPHGGEAEFDWSLEAPADPDVRPADPYPSLERALPSLSSAVRACAAPPLHVTAYVDDSGQVVAAGAASPEPASQEALDCVTDSLVGVVLVSPGSYAAKLSAVLP